MTIKRQNVGDIDFTLAVYRDGKKLQTGSGNWDLREYIAGFEIYESIQSATIEAMMIVSDAGGLIGAFTGTEKFELRIKGTVYDRTYWLRSYEINSRSRSSQNNEVYIVNLASDEYIKNEVVNVFGNSNKIFNDTETSAIIRTLMTNIDKIGTQKKLFLEQTLNRHSFVIPNWRPFDAIYWMAERSIRKSQSGGILQNGFAFYENAMGYHYKSIDQMIEDIADMSEDGDTNFTTGKPRLYQYSYAPKSAEDDQSGDQFKISTIVFPDEKNYLMGLRHGAWSGYSIGFDPVSLPSSQIGLSEDMPSATYQYSLSDMWNKMEHLDNKNSVNPYSQIDNTVKDYINTPRRIRYNPIPNRVFDNKDGQAQATYTELSQLEAYEFARIESLKNVMINIEIPGNLDLYAGTGIDIGIPASYNSDRGREVDQRYSGRYLIRRVKHNVASGAMTMTSQLTLVKDSVIRQKGQL